MAITTDSLGGDGLERFAVVYQQIQDSPLHIDALDDIAKLSTAYVMQSYAGGVPEAFSEVLHRVAHAAAREAGIRVLASVTLSIRDGIEPFPFKPDQSPPEEK